MKIAAGFAVSVPLCFLFGCAPPVTGPTVQIIRPAPKPMDQFNQDIASCEQYASQRQGMTHDNVPDDITAVVLHIVVTPNSPPLRITGQQHYDIVYAQCMVGQGNILPGYVASQPVPNPRRAHVKTPQKGAAGEEFVEPAPSTAPVSNVIVEPPPLAK